MQLKGINQALSDLISSGRTNTNPTYSYPGFEVVDIFPTFKHCFNANALKTLNNKCDQFLYQYNKELMTPALGKLLSKLELKTCKGLENGLWIRKVDKVESIASRATKDKLHLAVEKVIVTVNHVADKGFTKASMMPLDVLKTYPCHGAEPEYIVLSYITLTEQGAKYVAQNLPKMFTSEGGPTTAVEEQ